MGGFGPASDRARWVRVRLVDGVEANSAERLFCERARFATAADAMRVCASRGMTVEIYRESLFASSLEAAGDSRKTS